MGPDAQHILKAFIVRIPASEICGGEAGRFERMAPQDDLHETNLRALRVRISLQLAAELSSVAQMYSMLPEIDMFRRL